MRFGCIESRIENIKTYKRAHRMSHKARVSGWKMPSGHHPGSFKPKHCPHVADCTILFRGICRSAPVLNICWMLVFLDFIQLKEGSRRRELPENLPSSSVRPQPLLSANQNGDETIAPERLNHSTGTYEKFTCVKFFFWERHNCNITSIVQCVPWLPRWQVWE